MKKVDRYVRNFTGHKRKCFSKETLQSIYIRVDFYLNSNEDSGIF